MALPKTPQRKAVKELFEDGIGPKEILVELHQKGFKDIQTVGGIKGLLSRMAQDGEIVRGRRKKPGVNLEKPRPAGKEKPTPPLKESFPFVIWTSLFSAKHCKKMKSAVWEFGKLLGKVTKEVEYKGKVYGLVLGGKAITTASIAKELGRGNVRPTKEHIKTLREGGYILTGRTRYGCIYVFPNSNGRRSAKIITSKDPDWWKYSKILDKIVTQKHPRSAKKSTSPEVRKSDSQKCGKVIVRSAEKSTSHRRIDNYKITRDNNNTEGSVESVVVKLQKIFKNKLNKPVINKLLQKKKMGSQDIKKILLNAQRSLVYAKRNAPGLFKDTLEKSYDLPTTPEELRKEKHLRQAKEREKEIKQMRELTEKATSPEEGLKKVKEILRVLGKKSA